MANLSDRLKQFQETSKSEHEAIERMLQSAFDELRSKLTALQQGAQSTIESDTRKFLEDVSRSLDASRTAFERQAHRQAAEARTWSDRVMVVWSSTGLAMIVWLLLLIGGTVWSVYLSRAIPQLRGEVQSYEEEKATYELLRTHHVKAVEENGGLWFLTNPSAQPRKGKGGTLWLLAESKSGTTGAK